MNVNELSDSEVLRAASGSLSRLPVASPPEVETIVTRGRARRRHRLSAVAGLSATAAAAGTALVLGLTGVLGSARTPVTIKTASFTLVSNSNGTDTLTLNPSELLQPAQLQSDLQANGIPAMVTSGSICTSSPAPAGFSQVVSVSPAGPSTSTPTTGPQPTITIDPSAMPAGTELSVGYFQLTSGQYAGEQQADMLLVNTGSYTCSNTAPDPVGQLSGYGEDDDFGVLYGGPGQSGS